MSERQQNGCQLPSVVLSPNGPDQPHLVSGSAQAWAAPGLCCSWAAAEPQPRQAQLIPPEPILMLRPLSSLLSDHHQELEMPTDVLHVQYGSEWTGFSSLCKILDLTHQFGEIFTEKLSNFLSDLPHRISRDGRDPWGSAGPTTPDQGNLRVTRCCPNTSWTPSGMVLWPPPWQTSSVPDWLSVKNFLPTSHVNYTKPFCRNHGDLVHV